MGRPCTANSRELQRVANGEPLKPVSLRKDDFWHELAADFNAALARMQRDNSAAATIESSDDERADCERRITAGRATRRMRSLTVVCDHAP